MNAKEQNPYAHRSRTTRAELAYLVRLLPEVSRRTAAAARLELSMDGGEVVAQIIGDIAVPLAARGADGPKALRALVDEIERVAAERRKRRRR